MVCLATVRTLGSVVCHGTDRPAQPAQASDIRPRMAAGFRRAVRGNADHVDFPLRANERRAGRLRHTPRMTRWRRGRCPAWSG